MSLGHLVNVGGVESVTEICCTQLFELPQPSVATQVRSTPVQLPVEIASVKVIITAPPPLSVAVAVPVAFGSDGDVGEVGVEKGHSPPAGGVPVTTDAVS